MCDKDPGIDEGWDDPAEISAWALESYSARQHQHRRDIEALLQRRREKQQRAFGGVTSLRPVEPDRCPDCGLLRFHMTLCACDCGGRIVLSGVSYGLEARL